MVIDFEIKEKASTAQRDLELYKQLKALRKISIYVGIPEKNARREDSNEMNNATLLAIHTKGSPLRGLPARPVIEPAISNNAERVADNLRKIIKSVLDGKFAEAKKNMALTGQDTVNIIHNWFDDPRNGWPPDDPETVKAKLRKTRKTLKKRKEIFQKYQQGEENINTVLVDTDEMRRAITYVLGEDK